MHEFTKSLRTGKLSTTGCLSCKKLIWPPSEICPRCLSNNTQWVQLSTKGKLLEFSESFVATKPGVFGIVELDEKVRLLGRIICNDISELEKGKAVRMTKCGVDNDEVFYEFQAI